jgi:hypothetical protein
MKFTRQTVFLILVGTIILVLSIISSKNQISSSKKLKRGLVSSFAKKFKKARISNTKSKSRSKAVEDKYLPNIKGENKLFVPIRLKFVHVDEKIEYNKRASPMSDDNYIKFMSMVIKPVEEYFKKVISLYPVSGKTGATCQTQVPDITPEGKKMVQFRQKADDFIENHVSLTKIILLSYFNHKYYIKMLYYLGLCFLYCLLSRKRYDS